MSRKIALYARVSTRGQELENQLAELSAACARNDWQVVRVFTDYGISGVKGRTARKSLDDLLNVVVRREIRDHSAFNGPAEAGSFYRLVG